MRIGILGAGLMGGKLGTILARAGHDVTFSYSRDAAKLARLARDAGSGARAGSPEQAARGAEVVVLAVHWDHVDDVLRQAGDLTGKVLVTCSLPMNAANTDLVVGLTTSGAEELARRAPGARVVSAFGTVPSEVLFAVYATRDGDRPDLAYCGDDEAAKETVATLIRDAGFAPVDAGPLRTARYLEPFTLLMGYLAYETAGGPAVTYRFEWREEREG